MGSGSTTEMGQTAAWVYTSRLMMQKLPGYMLPKIGGPGELVLTISQPLGQD
jgi:hypothetical protein